VTFGNLLTCDKEAVVLRLLQRLDGGWIVLAHNPTAKALSTTIRGTTGGPAAGFKEKAKLPPGGEQRWSLP
jgi:hypothetical protein